MPRYLTAKYIFVSLVLHFCIAVLLQSSFLSDSQVPVYTNIDVATKLSEVVGKNIKFAEVKSISKNKSAEQNVQTAQAVVQATNNNFNTTSDLPLPADSQLVTEGLIPINLNEINKTIKRTKSATENNIEGVIKLKLLVDETGHVRQVTALTQLGYGLDEVALAAAWKLIFKPARIDSKNVALETIYSVKFDITHQ